MDLQLERFKKVRGYWVQFNLNGKEENIFLCRSAILFLEGYKIYCHYCLDNCVVDPYEEVNIFLIKTKYSRTEIYALCSKHINYSDEEKYLLSTKEKEYIENILNIKNIIE